MISLICFNSFCIGSSKRTRARWSGGIRKLINIPPFAELSKTMKDWLSTEAGGLFLAITDKQLMHGDRTLTKKENGECALFKKPDVAMVQYYLLMINRNCMMHYHENHAAFIEQERLQRQCPDAIVLMYDGSGAKNVHGSNSITVGSMKWTGMKKGFQSSTQLGLYWFISNRSEDNRDNKMIQSKEIEAIRNISGKHRISDYRNRIHTIDFSNTSIKMVMDGKATRNFLNCKGAAEPPSSWAVSVLKPCDTKTNRWARSIGIRVPKEAGEDEYWEQCSLFKKDCLKLNNWEFLQADISSDLGLITEYLQAKKNQTPVLLFTNPELLRKKIEVLAMWYNEESVEVRGGHNDEDRKQWFKKNMNRLDIEFYDVSAKDTDIRGCMIGVLHLFQRNADKMQQYFTVSNKVFGRKVIAELEEMAKVPELQKTAETLRKITEQATKKTNIKTNIDGNRVKKLAKIFLRMVIKAIPLIEQHHEKKNGDKDPEAFARFHKLIAMYFVFYIEATFSFLSNILQKFGDEYEYDKIRDELKKEIKHGIDYFFWFYSKCPWMTTPTTFDTFISLLFNLDNLLYQNKKYHLKVTLKDLSDQITENNVKVIKDFFKNHSNKKEGQCEFIMNAANFGRLASMDNNILVLKGDNPSQRNSISSNTWFTKSGIYDEYSNLDNFSKKALISFRKLEHNDLPEIVVLSKNNRVRDLHKTVVTEVVAQMASRAKEKANDDEDVVEHRGHNASKKSNSNHNNNNNKKSTNKSTNRSKNNIPKITMDRIPCPR